MFYCYIVNVTLGRPIFWCRILVLWYPRFSSVLWNWVSMDASLDMNITTKIAPIKFIYLDKYYEEIKYSEAFSFESFISNLGGFIGMFLGFSLSQIPETFNNLVTLMKYK